MNQPKPVFLVTKALILEPQAPKGYFNPDLQLTTASKEDPTPLVLSGVSAPTHSKTLQHPGDDDPDREQDRCY